MSEAIPRAARRVLESGVLCYLGVSSRHGPHLTPVVFVYDGGRVWVTTARRSVKAMSWRTDPVTAGLIRSQGLALSFRGTVRTYDALDPFSWPGAAAAGPRLMRASAKFAFKNARFFAGYAADARRVPFAWSPPGRVFAGIRLVAGRLLDLERAEVVAAWGGWPEGARYLSTFTTLPRRRGLDRRAPAAVREAMGDAGEGALALDGLDGLTVLPAAWRRVASEGAFDISLLEAFASLSRAGGRAPAALTLDRASAWRASAMKGMLAQGQAELFAAGSTRRGRRALGERAEPGKALVRLRPSRVVWWQGWSSGTVSDSAAADGRSAKRGRSS